MCNVLSNRIRCLTKHKLELMKSIVLMFCLTFSLFAGLFESPVTKESNAQVIQMFTAISQKSTVRVTFVQTKVMKALKKPLVAEGSLVFVKSKGLIWNQRVPYPEMTIIKSDGTIRYRNDSGREVIQKNGGADQINTMMNALFAGNMGELKKQFEIYFIGEKDQWNLGLLPKKEAIKKGLEKMTVICSKSGIVSEIFMVGSGGTTSIRFVPQVSQKPLASEEKLLD